MPTSKQLIDFLVIVSVVFILFCVCLNAYTGTMGRRFDVKVNGEVVHENTYIHINEQSGVLQVFTEDGSVYYREKWNIVPTKQEFK